MDRALLDKIYSANGTISKSLVCIFCERLLMYPYRSNCGHRSCQTCLETARQLDDAKCPQCDLVIDDSNCDYAALRELNELIVTCPMDCCVYEDRIGKLCEHFSSCTVFENGDDRNISENIDVIQEVVKMKQNIDILTKNNEQMCQLTDECRNFRTLTHDITQRHEKSLRRLTDEMQECFLKIEYTVIDSNEEMSYLRNDFCKLRDHCSSLEQYMQSLNQYINQIQKTVSELCWKMKNIGVEKPVTPTQFQGNVKHQMNELSILKRTNENSVVNSINKLSRDSDELNKVATILPQLNDRLNTLRTQLTDVIENRVEYDKSEIIDMEMRINDTHTEIDSLKNNVKSLINLYPNSVFVTIYFQKNVGLNVNLYELERLCHQLECVMATIKKDMSRVFGSDKTRLDFIILDRKKKLGSRIIDKV